MLYDFGQLLGLLNASIARVFAAEFQDPGTVHCLILRLCIRSSTEDFCMHVHVHANM